MEFRRSIALGERLHDMVPGAAHTYAKGDDQFPEGMAPVIERGAGSHVWDVDGNEYIEYGNGLRAVLLGHAYPAVNDAAKAAMDLGTNFVRPAAIEADAAETFLGLIGGADMVKFCKNGSDAATAAVRLARAATGREKVAICLDHPFFSVDDWFIGTTAMHSGIPETVRAMTVGFRYNDLASLERVFQEHPDDIACAILEPEKNTPPADGYLQAVVDLCRAHGAVSVFDEMITGFRWHAGGAQTRYGVTPDLSTFGKSMGNGFAVSALAGRRELMERGGLRHTGDRVFLLSTTHGAETHALAAGIAVMETVRDEPVVATLEARGEALRAGIGEAARRHGVQEHVRAIGRPQCMVYTTTDADGEPSQPYRTLFLQETIARGLLMPSLVLSYSHSDDDIERTVDAIDGALQVYGRALEDGVERHLRGRPVQPVFRRFNQRA